MKSRGTISLLIATLMICLAAPAWGKALLEDDHSKAEKAGRTVTGGSVIPGKNGLKAWRGNSASEPGDDVLVYDFVPGKDFLPERGTIEILFQRTRTGGHVQYVRTGSVYEAILDLVREDRKDALALYVVWKDERDTSTTSLVIWGSEYGKFSDVFGKRISLGRVVQVGEMVHLALTWGPGGAKDNHVFINGKEVPPDDPSQREGNLTRYIGNVRWLKIGADSTDPKMWPGGRNPIYGAAIYKIVVHDDVVTTFDLSAVIPTIRNVSDDSFQVARISGKLVAGDTVTATLVAVPGGTASFDLGDVKGIAMEEVPATEGGPGIPAVDNGTYQGSYTIRPGDDYEDGYIVGHFVSADNVVADPVTSDSKWTIETKPQVTFDIDRKDMPADSSTKARIKLVAEDANGDPVQGRHLKLTLATTEEYTGTVGAGDFGENVGATVETRWKGETDAWGEVEFDYVAGFAAKTVILTAKDLDSGGVTVDYITAYKEAAIDIALTPPVNRAAARRGVQYIVKVEASRKELTADGRSRSVIRATVMDPNGTPVAGDPVTFTLSSENGTLRTIKETTDSAGVATAEYRAGKKIGIVVVTATATLRNAQGSVSIILLSDAPAKIYLKARPETLPADGFSRSDLEVKVTDINDNPNQDTKVEFRVAKGGGKLDYADRVTDRFGDATNRYTSGTAPGVATIVATVRSKVPTETELAKAKNVLFAPYSPEGDEIRVEKWLKKKGDSFVKGDPLVEYTVGRSATVYVIAAPYDGTLEEIFVEYWDNAEVGQTLAVIPPAK
jgi:hypothetical protein